METGIDLVKIENIQTIKKLNRIFTEKELEYYQYHNSLATLAGIYAAKEALLKSIQVALNVYPVTEIEVLHKENGAPYLNFYGSLAEYIKKERLKFSLSISHDGDYAIAIVIAHC